ncbi:hypothetical protein J540_3445 [Acinetobacter baumannii 1440422]|nr:hypothetical protein J540_3445 [Acinetobacter baumannii 1440422]
MDSTEYFWLTRKKEPKTKPKSWPLPKPTQKYLEVEEEFTETLDNLEIKYEKKFQFKSALLHKDLKVKTSHIYSNLNDNSGMWSA